MHIVLCELIWEKHEKTSFNEWKLSLSCVWKWSNGTGNNYHQCMVIHTLFVLSSYSESCINYSLTRRDSHAHTIAVAQMRIDRFLRCVLERTRAHDFWHYQRRYYYSVCGVDFFIPKFPRLTYMRGVDVRTIYSILHSYVDLSWEIVAREEITNGDGTLVTNECPS